MTDGASRSVGVLMIDRDLAVVTWDAWLAAATGIDGFAAIGLPLTSLVPDLEERHLVDRIRRVIDEGVVQVLAPAFHHYLIACAPRAASAHFHLMQQHVTITPWRRSGEIIGAVITIEDVTARLDRERELAADLRSADEAIRLRATQALAAENASPAALVDAFGDTSWRVRRTAVEAMAAQSGEEVAGALLAALRDQHRDFSVLNATLSALALSGEDVLPELLRLLEDDDADVRIYVALGLGHLGSARAVPALMRALNDPEPNVRFHAIEALGRLRARATAETLADIATSGDFFLGFAALDALAQLADARVAPRLVPLLQDPALAGAAAHTLGLIGDEDVVMPLAAALRDTKVSAAGIAGALAALHRRFAESFGEGALVADLARSAIDATSARRLVAELGTADANALPDLVLVLGWLPFDGIAEALAQLLAHRALRTHALEALVHRGRAALPALLEQLEDGVIDARKAAAAALSRIGNADAVPALIQALEGPSELIVVATAALGSIGDRAAFEPIVALLGHDDAPVRFAAVAALNSLGHHAMPARIRELLEAPQPAVRESAARIAGYFGYRECTDAMLRLCSDPQENVRRAAVESIGLFQDARIADAVRNASQDPATAVRAAAAQAATHLPETDATAALTDALHDRDAWVRYCAARASVAHADALAPALGEVIAHDDAPHVRIAAVDTLGAVASDQVAAVLVPLTSEPNAELAAAAVRALARMKSDVARRAVRDALSSGDTDRCRAVLSALREGDRIDDAVDEIEQLIRRSADRRLALHAIALLGHAGAPAAVDALLRLAAEASLRVPCTAALAGVREDLLDAVGAGLHSPSSEIRCAVVEALARRKHAHASRLIATALEDDAPEVRLAAAHALRRMDLRAAERELTATARADDDADVRRAAQKALARQ